MSILQNAPSGNLGKVSIKGFIVLYVALAISFVAIGPRIFSSNWVSSSDFHACIEIVSSFVAIIAAVACLMYFFGLSSRYFLIIGLGFFICGSEDLIHGIFSFRRLFEGTDVDFSRFVPGTYVAGRAILALTIIAAPLLDHVMKKPGNEKREAITFSAIAVILGGGATALAFTLPLPQFIFPDQLISRPGDFFTAVLFLVAFVLVLRRYLATRDIFSGILLASILLNLGGQVYMSFSKQLFDAFFDVAHFANVLSYIMPVLGIAMQGLDDMKKVRLESAERARAEQALAAEKERLGVTLSSMSEGVIALDTAKGVMLLNPAAQNLTGWTFEDAEGKPCDEVFRIDKKDTWKTAKDPIDEVLLSGKVEKLADDTTLIAKDGTERAIACSAAPIRLDDGTIIGIVLVFRDVAHEREVDRMKTDFVSSVSHELRTPMTSIKGFTGTILRDPDMPVETRNHFLEIINEETDRLSSLVEDLLEVSRIEAGRVYLEHEPIDVEDVVDTTIQSVEQSVVRKKLQVRCEIPKNLPKPAGDAGKIQTVLLNLVGNAIKFTPEGGQITVRAFTTDECVAIQVEDSGMGIPRKDLSQIFERFYRVDRPGTEIGGTGLGLAIAKQFVELHDGRIEVRSKEGEGTTFTAYLPVNGSSDLQQKEKRSEQQYDVASDSAVRSDGGRQDQQDGTAWMPHVNSRNREETGR